ncbi:SMI1/KNR4 family protein [Macrococcus capreoli]
MEFSKLKNHIKVDGKVTKSDIEKFESWRGYKLPKDFVEFTLKYPGATLSVEFDAEDRPGSMISNFLRFSKEGYSSIYVDEAYDIKDFGPYVLFGEDPGGNYIAFDYSTDELNPSVVFIEHEELGVLELPEGKTENDFTKEELDRMMSSEKLEDFPWAIHDVSNSFSDFISRFEFEDYSDLQLPRIKNTEVDIKYIEEYLNIELPNEIKEFLLKYGGASTNLINADLYNYKFIILSIISSNKEGVMIDSFIENRGGKTKFSNLIPLLSILISDNFQEISAVALYQTKQNNSEIVIIPHNVLASDENIKYEDLIVLTDDIKDFVDKITRVINDK